MCEFQVVSADLPSQTPFGFTTKYTAKIAISVLAVFFFDFFDYMFFDMTKNRHIIFYMLKIRHINFDIYLFLNLFGLSIIFESNRCPKNI